MFERFVALSKHVADQIIYDQDDKELTTKEYMRQYIESKKDYVLELDIESM